MKELQENSRYDQPYPFAQRIERWPIEKLIPYARNPRSHSDAQVAQIAASIAEFGFVNPVLVDNDAGIIAACSAPKPSNSRKCR